MSRPLRIQYPDTWYPVMNRGRRGESVFLEKRDYSMFVELLKEAVDMYKVKVAAYCLIPNHYHLLIQTPGGDLVIVQVAIEFTKLPGKVIQGLISKIIKERPRHTK